MIDYIVYSLVCATCAGAGYYFGFVRGTAHGVNKEIARRVAALQTVHAELDKMLEDETLDEPIPHRLNRGIFSIN